MAPSILHYAAQPIKAISPVVGRFFHFLGIADVEFVHAEGLAVSEASKQAGLAQAHRAIEQLGAPERFALAA